MAQAAADASPRHLVEQADPAFDMNAFISEKARPVMEITRTACLDAAWEAIEDQKLSQAAAFTQDPLPTVARATAANAEALFGLPPLQTEAEEK